MVHLSLILLKKGLLFFTLITFLYTVSEYTIFYTIFITFIKVGVTEGSYQLIMCP
uniref:Uncharacterized protein n=1 Tax=Anguilla anguilla TaxID=7936 RepID=A0A0E9XTJ4_ANGAN